MNCEPFPLIEIRGTPFARGELHGSSAAARVRHSANHYHEQIRAMGVEDVLIGEIVDEYLPEIEAFDADYVEEMRGIAAGADIELARVVLINARTEILQLARRRMAAPPLADDPDGCTGVVVLPGATASGALIHGLNWDWKAVCAETAVVLRIRRDDGPDVLTFTEAGSLARAGYNSQGTAVTANYLESDRDYQQAGVPLACIRRKILESDAFALAIRVAACTPKSASNNLMLSSADGVAVDFECAPDESFALYPTNGLLVHANHWQSPVALSKLKDTGIPNTPDSFYRDWIVAEHLKPHLGRVTPDHVKAALFDEFGSPWSVCRPPRPSFVGNLSATVAMLIMQPGEDVMDVAPLPALNRKFTRYSLGGIVREDESPARRAAASG